MKQPINELRKELWDNYSSIDGLVDLLSYKRLRTCSCRAYLTRCCIHALNSMPTLSTDLIQILLELEELYIQNKTHKVLSYKLKLNSIEREWLGARAHMRPYPPYEEWRTPMDEQHGILVAIDIATRFTELIQIERVTKYCRSASASCYQDKIAQGNKEYRWQVNALKDVFVNPFMVFEKGQAWRTNFTVLSIAQTIREEKDFSQMPVLGDALEDAGCTDSYLIEHCHLSIDVHLPGCWVLRLLLDKHGLKKNVEPEE